MLTAGGELYHLRGVVSFIAPDAAAILGAEEEVIGHYCGLVLRSDRQWELFDGLQKRSYTVRGATKVFPHALLYTR